MRLVCLLFPSVFILTGCGVSVPDSVQTPQPLVQEVDSKSQFSYRNTRFGYTMNLPEDLVVYALTPEQTAVLADEQAEVVFVVEEETNFFTVRGVEDSRSAHEWVTDHLSFFYPTGDAAQRVAEFAGHQAIILRGTGSSDSPAKLIVFRYNDHLIVISYEQDTPVFELLLEGFSTI